MERRAVARCSTPPTRTFTAISADRASTRNVAPRVRRIQVCKLTPHIVVSCCAVHPGVEIEPGHHAINARRASELRCRSKRPRPRRQADRASHDPHGTQCERQYPAIRRLIPRRAAINGRFFGDDATSRGRACDNRRSNRHGDLGCTPRAVRRFSSDIPGRFSNDGHRQLSEPLAVFQRQLDVAANQRRLSRNELRDRAAA